MIVLIAAFLRLYRLPGLPPGLNFDEAGNGVAALDILAGAPQLWWRIGGGKEPVWPYLIALSTTLLGNIPLALRLPAALAGILTVAAVYPLMAILFRGHQGRAIGLLAALGLALSSWHLHFSRLGFRAILFPLFSTLAFYFLWRSFSKWQVASGKWQTSPSSNIPAPPDEPPIPPTPLTTPLQSNPNEIRTETPQPSAIRNPQSAIKSPQSAIILASFFIALSIYAYLAGRFLPLVLLLYFPLHRLLHYFHHRHHSPNSSGPGKEKDTDHSLFSTLHPPSSILHPLLSLLLLLILFLAPLIIYFLFNPADLTARAAAVSIFNPAWNNGDLIGTAWRTLTITLGTFIGLTGDSNPLVNLPGQPAVPLLLVPFFVLGFIISLYRLIRPGSPAPGPHLFLLCWWSVMLLPALLAPEGAPHHLRLIGAIVPTYAFIALGLFTAVHLLTRLLDLLTPDRPETARSPQPEIRNKLHPIQTAYLLPVIIFLLIAIQTYTNYFIRWPAAVDFTLPFDLYAVRLVDQIAQAPPKTAYVLPMDIRAGAEARHYTLDYLLAHRRQPAPYTYIPVDERNAEMLLTQAAAGRERLRVVRWTADKHREADAKEIMTYLLETQANRQERASFPVYDLETYGWPGSDDPDCRLEAPHKKSAVERDCERPPHSVSFALPPINQPLEATFDHLLQIRRVYVRPTAAPGHQLPVALAVAPLAPMEVDYKISLRLLGPTGRRLAQKDRMLRHNFHQGTSLWPPETVNEYFLLPIPPETPPGQYTVAAVIYHPETQAPLVAAGVVEVPLGPVRVK